MTILQMKYFVTICEAGSLSFASKQLYVTQPALSSTVKELEKHYNVTLFERSHSGLKLTDAGEFFYKESKHFLELYERFEKDLMDLSNSNHLIRIGVPPMIGSFLFPQIYNQYMIHHPSAKFEIWEEGSLTIRKKIQNKTLDMGFSILNDSANEHYHKELIIESELLYCVSSKNPISKKKEVTINDIKDESMILMKEGFFQNQLINNMFADLNQNPKIVLVSSQLSVIRNFVKMNAGGAFLMKELIDDSDDSIIGIPFKTKLKLSIGLIWQKDIELRAGAAEFVAFLRREKTTV